MKLQLKDLYTYQGSIDRGTYLVWGLILFGIKYLIDRLVSGFVFNRPWFISDYFIQPDRVNILQLSQADINFYGTLAAIALPFIFAGTLLCIKRLRHIGLSPWWVVFFFILGVNFILFLVLCLLPGKIDSKNQANTHNNLFDRIIPINRAGNIALSIGLTLFIALIFALFSINFLEQYGWGLFLGIPFFLGFTSVALYNYHQYRKFGESIGIALSTLSAFALLVILIAVEGLICVLMAAPIGFLLAFMGGAVAHSLQSVNREGAKGMMLSLFVLIPLISYWDVQNSANIPLLQVQSFVIIEASPQRVWNKLINFSQIAEPKELLFKSGIAYPVKARIEGKGVGAMRYCVFNTGEFVEPIEVWNEPSHLRFSVKSQPEPLRELSPYKNLDVPHLHGYFESTQGEFRLIKLAENRTRLEGTTWYSLKILPVAYWQIYTDYILHAIHLRVLNHIKKDAEEK